MIGVGAYHRVDQRAPPFGLFVIGTKRTGRVRSVSVPAAVRRRIRSSWVTVPTGMAMSPPTFSCCTRAGGTSSGAAVTMTRSYGACSGHPSVPFDAPEGVSFVEIDRDTGKLALPGCPRTISESFIAGTEPGEYCELHRW